MTHEDIPPYDPFMTDEEFAAFRDLLVSGIHPQTKPYVGPILHDWFEREARRRGDSGWYDLLAARRGITEAA